MPDLLGLRAFVGERLHAHSDARGVFVFTAAKVFCARVPFALGPALGAIAPPEVFHAWMLQQCVGAFFESDGQGVSLQSLAGDAAGASSQGRRHFVAISAFCVADSQGRRWWCIGVGSGRYFAHSAFSCAGYQSLLSHHALCVVRPTRWQMHDCAALARDGNVLSAPPLPAIVGGDSGVRKLPTPQPRHFLRTNGIVRRQYEVPVLVDALLLPGQLRGVHFLRRPSQDPCAWYLGRRQMSIGQRG